MMCLWEETCVFMLEQSLVQDSFVEQYLDKKCGIQKN
jgi:hypothetical protein